LRKKKLSGMKSRLPAFLAPYEEEEVTLQSLQRGIEFKLNPLADSYGIPVLELHHRIMKSAYFLYDYLHEIAMF